MNRRLAWTGLALLGVVVSACAAEGAGPSEPMATGIEAGPTPLPDLGPAPELGSEIWLNSERPLRLAELRGKVVLIDFWTFG